MVKKYKSLVMSITTIVCLSIMIAIWFVGLSHIIYDGVFKYKLTGAGKISDATAIIISCFNISILGISMVFNVVMSKISNSTHNKNREDKEYVVVASGINFFIAFLYFIMILLGSFEIISFILMVIINICSGVIYCVDFFKNSSNSLQSCEQATSNTVEKPKEDKKVVDNKKFNKKLAEEDSLLDKLKKLEEMKEKKLISKKEYDELKKSYIAKELEK